MDKLSASKKSSSHFSTKFAHNIYLFEHTVSNFFGYKLSFLVFFRPKQFQKSRFILQDRPRSLGLSRKGKIGIIAKFHRTDFVICSHSREVKTPSFSRMNMIFCPLPNWVLQ